MEEVSAEVLEGERIALRDDRELYLECLNGKPFCERKSPLEIRDGLILYWMVYYRIKSMQGDEEAKKKKVKKGSKKSKG